MLESQSLEGDFITVGQLKEFLKDKRDHFKVRVEIGNVKARCVLVHPDIREREMAFFGLLEGSERT